MNKNTLALAIAGVLTAGLAGCNSTTDTTTTTVAPTATSVTFSATPVASTDTEYLTTYTKSVATVTYSDGTTKDFPLTYNSLFKNTDQISTVNGAAQASAQLYDVDMKPLLDPNGDPVIAETADANSLLKVGSNMFLVNHWEYDNILADGQQASTGSGYSRMPMEMSLSSINQAGDGKLSVTKQEPVNFASVQGGWIFCAGGPTPWNTHMGG